MFCFQCEQAAHCTGCTGSAGVCGKSAETANLQDELTGALIGLARAADGSPGVNEGTWSLIIEALFTTLTNVNFDEAAIRDVTACVKAEKSRLVPDCASCMSPCGHNNDYDVSRLWTEDEDIRSLKSLILFGIRGMAAYAYAAFHEKFIKGHITLVGCPKLDSVDYSEKLTEIIAKNDIKSVTVVRMEVPCCGGLEHAAKTALQNSGKFIPWQVVTISTDGRILDTI